MRYFVLVIFVAIICACKKSENEGQLACCTAPILLSAVLEQTGDIACGKPLVFVEDTTSLKNYPTLSGHRFVLNELPDSLKVLNNKLQLVVTFLPTNREFECPGIGPSYPHVQFISGRTQP